jgi:large subunit ribosomal protein L23
MKKQHPILIKPILTEKALKMQESDHRYSFVVDREANKIEIKQAVVKKFQVRVEEVRTIFVKGKTKRQNTRRGVTFGQRSNWKKAIVTLHKEDKIDFFEGTQTK